MLHIEEIADGFYLFRTSETDFNRNIYLRRYKKDGEEINLLMDPGGRKDFSDLTSTLGKLMLKLSDIQFVFLSHQDPDLVSNVSAISKSSQATFIMSEDSWRLVNSYGIDASRYIATQRFPDGKGRLPTGNVIQFVPAYYCHFRGACMLYDIESGILFTGDFMGGLTTRSSNGVYANEDSWSGIKTFHQIYMPNTLAIRQTIARIKRLEPRPTIIAPQHGDIIAGPYVNHLMDKLDEIKVGLDIMEDDELSREIVTKVINKTLRLLKKHDEKLFNDFVSHLRDSKNMTPLFTIQGEEIEDMKVDYAEGVNAFIEAVRRDLPEEIVGVIEANLVSEIDELALELPDSLCTNKDIKTPADTLKAL